MRQPKPSDVQALQVIHDNIKNITMNITRLNGELIKLYKEIDSYLKQETGETVDVQTTHGLSADSE